MDSKPFDTPPAAHIVVGFDGLTPSRTAVLWAAHEAAATGAQLRVVVAWQPEAELENSSDRVRQGPDDALELARVGAALARDVVHGGGALLAQVLLGPAAAVLPAQATPAALLVLGAGAQADRDGASQARDSTMLRCVAEATVPVVLVSEEAHLDNGGRIVLTVHDGAVAGPAARWAVSRAARTRRPLHIVDTWQRLDEDGASVGANRTARRAAGERHGQAMTELGRALAGRALITGSLVDDDALGAEWSRTGPGDLIVLPRDDFPGRSSMLRRGCPVVVVPEPAVGLSASIPGQASARSASRAEVEEYVRPGWRPG